MNRIKSILLIEAYKVVVKALTGAYNSWIMALIWILALLVSFSCSTVKKSHKSTTDKNTYTEKTVPIERAYYRVDTVYANKNPFVLSIKSMRDTVLVKENDEYRMKVVIDSVRNRLDVECQSKMSGIKSSRIVERVEIPVHTVTKEYIKTSSDKNKTESQNSWFNGLIKSFGLFSLGFLAGASFLFLTKFVYR